MNCDGVLIDTRGDGPDWPCGLSRGHRGVHLYLDPQTEILRQRVAQLEAELAPLYHLHDVAYDVERLAWGGNTPDGLWRVPKRQMDRLRSALTKARSLRPSAPVLTIQGEKP